MTIAGWDLQMAAVDALKADTAVMAIATGIYDFVPKAATLPYVRVSIASSRPWTAKTLDGAEHVLRLDLWTDGLSREMVLNLADLTRLRLETGLALAGASLVLVRFEFLEIVPEPDGEALHGVMRFRALVHQ